MLSLILILTGSLLLLGLLARYLEKRRKTNGVPEKEGRTVDDGCCGAHEVCEKESLLAAVSEKPVYFDDEELDRFAGRTPESYDEAERAEFQDIFETLRESEMAEWARSLQLRGIELPDFLREELLLVIRERRNNARP